MTIASNNANSEYLMSLLPSKIIHNKIIKFPKSVLKSVLKMPGITYNINHKNINIDKHFLWKYFDNSLQIDIMLSDK